MKVAFNQNYVAIRTGEFVDKSINTDAGEFVLDETSTFGNSVLKEVAAKNNVDLAGIKGKEATLAAILEKCGSLGLPTMDTMPQNETVKELVRVGVEAGKSDEDLLIEIVVSGVKFSQAQKFLKSAKEELGLVTSQKDKREKVAEILGKDFAPETAEQVLEMLPKLTGAIEDMTDAQAKAQIRAYLKRTERTMPELPKAEKSAGGGKGGAGRASGGGVFSQFVKFMKENPKFSDDEARAFFRNNSKKGSEKEIDSRHRLASPFIAMFRELTA